MGWRDRLGDLGRLVDPIQTLAADALANVGVISRKQQGLVNEAYGAVGVTAAAATGGLYAAGAFETGAAATAATAAGGVSATDVATAAVVGSLLQGNGPPPSEEFAGFDPGSTSIFLPGGGAIPSGPVYPRALSSAGGGGGGIFADVPDAKIGLVVALSVVAGVAGLIFLLRR